MKVSLGGAVSVTATERWLSEIRAGRAFRKGSQQGAPGVGQNNVKQLFNPVGSAITVILFRALVLKPTTATVNFGADNTARGANSGFGENLLNGGAIAVGEHRAGSTAGALGLNTALTLQANVLTQLIYPWGFELGAAEGFSISSATANEALDSMFEWIEV